MTSISDKVPVTSTGSRTVYKRGEGSVNNAILLRLENVAAAGSSFENEVLGVASTFAGGAFKLAIFIGKITCFTSLLGTSHGW